MAEHYSVDESQLAVIRLPASARLLVTAGPGQGKTEVVASRLEYLVGEEDLTPADEVLVLSFSRAAVAAVRRRTAGRGRAERVAVRTFDSFASRLLMEMDVDPASGFDERIRQATSVLEDSRNSSDIVDLLRHVVIDEVQDLVGDRAQMVLALLRVLSPRAGFTALGDPQQAVYDFQLQDSRSQMPNSALFEALTGELGAVSKRLNGEYRAQTPPTKKMVEFTREVELISDPRSRQDHLAAAIQGLASVENVECLATLLPRWSGNTAVLCRTNGQAMEISKALGAAGVPHRLRRPAQEVAAPAWIAIALGRAPTYTVSRQQVSELVATTVSSPEPEQAWDLLKATERRRHTADTINLFALADRISAGDIPVELLDDGGSDLVVSTIHRAKGLEFDNVVIVEESIDSDEDGADARGRELFVALTRARRRLNSMSAPDMRFVYVDRRSHPTRWIRGGYKRWMTTGFEVVPSDVERRFPVETRNESVGQIQEVLAEGIPAGSTARGVLEPDLSNEGRPVYRLESDGRSIGLTNEDFGVALASRLRRVRRGQPRWPQSMEDLLVDGVGTFAGQPDVGPGYENRPGRWGLWLGVRVCGLASLRYASVQEGLDK